MGTDIGARGVGATKEEAFAQATLAVTTMVTEPTPAAAEGDGADYL
jgi:SHS2 domain-containing protein